jgi:signal transduction histidine kinase
MKLEKAVSRPKTGIYAFLFILGLAVAGVMATSYNIEIIVNNLRDNVKANFDELPWFKIILGSLGFLSIILALIVLFSRMVREIKISQFHADFLDRVSHELRTPLATLTLVSDLLRDPNADLSPDERSRLWNSHGLELERLRSDVESLLQAARLRETRQQPKTESFDLVAFMNQKWPSFQMLMGPEAELEFESATELRIEADPALLELILRNLLDNAKKFAIGPPKVRVVLRRDRKGFAILVVDQGRGFSPTEENRLFKRFSRIESTAGQRPEYAIPGTGLGLYLSASASRAMGMTLEGVSPGEGQGAIFTLKGAAL